MLADNPKLLGLPSEIVVLPTASGAKLRAALLEPPLMFADAGVTVPTDGLVLVWDTDTDMPPRKDWMVTYMLLPELSRAV